MREEKGYVRLVEDAQRGRGYRGHPYELHQGERPPGALRTICPCGAAIWPDLLTGLCPTCLRRPTFVVFELPDGVQLLSHPSVYSAAAKGEIGRQERWWYTDCQKCQQGIVLAEHREYSYQRSCGPCARRFAAFRALYRRQQAECVPVLANLFAHYQSEIERLHQIIAGNPTEEHPESRQYICRLLADDYRLVLERLENVVVGVPSWTWARVQEHLADSVDLATVTDREPYPCALERFVALQALAVAVERAIGGLESQVSPVERTV